ncbi:MAG: hypothetical protein R3B13_20940 [Polyangiaceae bacterium]
MMRLAVSCVGLFIFVVGCGGEGGSGPPVGSGGIGGGGGGAGGSTNTGGSAGTVTGKCPTGDELAIWTKLDGTYTLAAVSVDEKGKSSWSEGSSYDVTVDAAHCNITFQTNGDPEVCQWTGAEWNFAFEWSPTTKLTLHIQNALEQANSTSNGCEVNYRVDLDRMGTSLFFFPGPGAGTEFSGL